MKKQVSKKLFGLTIILILFSGCTPSLIDISPDRSNDGVSDGGSSTAGLVINMAGDKNGLYAIGLNSGVWKTEINENGSFNQWRQLAQSPRYAHSIAVDPNTPDHIAVGEREGDGIDTAQNNCGLWESYDGGKTFPQKNYFNPLTHPCRQDNLTQVVNGVIITNKSTTIITTPCGIGRKEYFEPTFTYAHFTTSQDDQTFTGIAVFKDWIVARTKTSIFISNDDGKNWNEHVIQFNFRFNIKNQNFTQSDREGIYSVSIMQEPQTNNVFVYLPVTRNPNGPCIAPDKGIDSCTGIQSSPPSCNYSSLLVFDNNAQQWNYQIIRERGLGTGLGGRVFMKSFYSKNTNLQNQVGGNTNLIYSTSQNFFRATNINADGTAVWQNIANANTCGEPKPSNFHSDIWDFLLDPLGWYSWISSDGGVYYFAMDTKQTTIGLNSENKYINLNSGLHTQHIHEAFVAGYLGDRLEDEHYGYGTQDNGGWKNVTTDNISNWKSIDGTTDVNIIEGDQGNTQFILTARNLQSAVLAGLQSPGSSPPSGAKLGPITISNISNNANSFQFIQTLNSENPNLMLDALMLTTLPMKYEKDKQVFNVPGELGSKTGTVIIRNTSFATNPDINLSLGSGWNIEFSDLPNGLQAFWVSGGHTDPTYFLICNQSNNTVIYKRKKSESLWTVLNMPAGVQIIPYAAGRVQHGPVFVNPYNPYEIYVSCKDGVYHGYIAVGGWIFSKDVDLTNLISGNGKYPIDKTFTGGNGANVTWSNQSSGNAMYPVSWISFNRYHPDQVVASSPFTGVFFKDGTKTWRDLSNVLPKPFTPVSAVNINNQGIYVTTEGRGIFKIVNY